MILPKKHINHADGGNSSPYTFGTLWQEITNGISSFGNTIVNGLQVTEKTEQLRDLYDIKGRQDWSVQVLETTKPNNTPGTFIMGTVVIAIIIVLVVIAVKQLKS